MSEPQSVNTADLRAWVERIRAGDKQAKEELLQATAARLETLARQMLRRFPSVRRWVETGDVLQSALLRLMRALETVDFPSMRDFYNLAAVQMRRELIDLARRFSGPQNAAAHHDSAFFPDAAAAETIDSTAEMERWAAFHTAVEQLPVEEREVVGLVFYHNWTQAQVAELFNVTPRTVRRWWQSAMLKLHEHMQQLKLV